MKQKHKIKKLYLFIYFILNCAYSIGQKTDTPWVGAQIWVEPGQTVEQLDTWFSLMHKSGMKVCRIRIHESDIHYRGKWDFSLYDRVFSLAEKYNIKVFATLFPLNSNKNIGGDKFPESQKSLDEFSEYIRIVVNHYKTSSVLLAWVIQNEPGVGGILPDNEYTKNKFEYWKENLLKNSELDVFRNNSFEKEQFLLNYETWYLNWIANEVLKNDSIHPLHVNNHKIFENIAEYDFPKWRKFLSSLGASIHPSWHFDLFDRNRYAFAVSENCELIKSGAGDIPFWVTELQGGTNLYSGTNPICPTKEEITQWLWISIVSNAEGIIFWTLNPRSHGREAGEWSLIDYQNQPSDRFNAAAKVIETINDNNEMFGKKTEIIEPKFHVLYSRESLWTEKHCQWSNSRKDMEARNQGAVIKSALAYCEVLIENGLEYTLSELNEFDWEKDSYKGEIIFLANQISIPTFFINKLCDFTKKGGKLLVTGLTGFFDENWNAVSTTQFPYEELLGASLKEQKYIGEESFVKLSNSNIFLPINSFKGTILNKTGIPIATENGEILAIRNKYGLGEVVWIPSNIEIKARQLNDDRFAKFVKYEIKQILSDSDIYFSARQKDVFCKTKKTENGYLSVIINKSSKSRHIKFVNKINRNPQMIFSDKHSKISNNWLTIADNETVVIFWK